MCNTEISQQAISHMVYVLGHNTGAKFQLICISSYRDNNSNFVFLR